MCVCVCVCVCVCDAVAVCRSKPSSRPLLVSSMAEVQAVKKPAMGAYGQWINANRASFAEQAAKDGLTGFGAAAKKGSEVWKGMGDADKAPWEQKYKEAQAAYQAYKCSDGFVASEKKRLTKALQNIRMRKEKDVDAPKWPVGGAFGRFLNAKRKEASDLFKSFTLEQKKPYHEEFTTAMEKYKVDTAAYKEKKAAEAPATPAKKAATKKKGRAKAKATASPAMKEAKAPATPAKKAAKAKSASPKKEARAKAKATASPGMKEAKAKVPASPAMKEAKAKAKDSAKKPAGREAAGAPAAKRSRCVAEAKFQANVDGDLPDDDLPDDDLPDDDLHTAEDTVLKAEAALLD